MIIVKNRNKKYAFSLIELMVVIAIIGILAAVAAPSYKSYVFKSKIANTIPQNRAILEKIIATHQETGAYPSSISVFGQTIASGYTINVSAYNTLGIYSIHYNSNNLGDPVVAFFLSDLNGITSDYLSPATNSITGKYAGYISRISFENDNYAIRCGSWMINDTLYFSKLEYLPSSCQCSSVSTKTC